ncbi:DUF763 domain-containing protein, partial [Xanthomonas perforans]
AGVEAPAAQGPLTGDLFAVHAWDPAQQPHLCMPDHHDVRSENVITRRLHASLAAAAEAGPRDFTALLQVPGVGARTLRSLAMVAEVMHGTPCRFSDPARFSLAHGGKDRQPFPVPTRVLDHTIGVLKQAMQQARLGNDERLQAIARLDAQARRLEASAQGPTVDDYIAQERRDAHRYGGGGAVGRWGAPGEGGGPAAADRGGLCGGCPSPLPRPAGCRTGAPACALGRVSCVRVASMVCPG